MGKQSNDATFQINLHKIRQAAAFGMAADPARFVDASALKSGILKNIASARFTPSKNQANKIIHAAKAMGFEL